MIDTYDLGEITWDDFKNNYIYRNKPCIIKKFINNANCPIEKFQEFVNNKNNTSFLIGNITALHGESVNLCNNSLVKGIENEMIVADKYRIWKHQKNNKTKWHYDGHGGDLYNICIQGSKHFYLAPPGSFPVYSLSNIALDIEFNEKYLIKLNPSEMLYIPAYWFHKVITLEDNTINMNYTFYGSHNKQISSQRDRDLYTLHNIFNSRMCVADSTKIICDIYSLNGYVYPSAILRGFYETIPFFVIFLVLFSINQILSFVYFSCICFILFYSRFNIISSGITKIVSIFTLLWMLMFYFMKLLISYYKLK